MKTNQLKISENIHKQLKDYCLKNCKIISKVAEKAITEYIKKCYN